MRIIRNEWKAACAAVIIGMAMSAPAFADDASKASKRSAEARYDLTVDQAEADYDAAKAQCKAMKGNERDVCMKDAKAEYEKAHSEAKAQRKTTAARTQADSDMREANYRTAKERCDALSGDAKDVCERDAKAKYGQ